MPVRYLEVALGGEGLLTDGALEGLVAGVCSHVDLERRGRGEILIANLAQVLAGHACKYTHTRNSLSCPQQSCRSHPDRLRGDFFLGLFSPSASRSTFSNLTANQLIYAEELGDFTRNFY